MWQCELGIKREGYRVKLGIYSCSPNRKCIVTILYDLKISVCQRYLDTQIQEIKCVDRYRKTDLLSEFAHWISDYEAATTSSFGCSTNIYKISISRIFTVSLGYVFPAYVICSNYKTGFSALLMFQEQLKHKIQVNTYASQNLFLYHLILFLWSPCSSGPSEIQLQTI